MKFPQIAALTAACLISASCLKSSLPELGSVPEFQLTGEDGQVFRSSEQLSNKVWVADFIFTTCTGPCPRMTSQMHKLQEETKELEDVSLVSFTVDPARDTPAVLAEYAKRFNYDQERWHFLTGSKEDLTKLSSGAFHLNDAGGTLEHSTRFVLVDRKGRIRGYYDTTDATALQQLKDDIAQVRKEVL
jgi:cytochrome oxidase Cu insertion factor (SCO1/SenC/PrrC family)